MAHVFLKKLEREMVPLLFFGTVVSLKVYFLVDALIIEGGWWKLLDLIRYSQAGSDEADPLIVGMVTFVFYSIVAILFDALVFASYLIRLEPKSRAKGFWETAYPLATVLLPVIGFTWLAATYNVQALAVRYDLHPMFLILLAAGGMMVGATGAILSFVALWSLKKSFSLMTEVRELVTTGLYRRIRHPLYMAEIIHILGIAILSARLVGMWLFVIAVTMQVVRAKIEEKKFLQMVPQYGEFKSNTGFLWPKLW